MISLEYHKKVAIVKLQRSITNPINLKLVTELMSVLQKVWNDSKIGSMILSSANDKFFSIGFNIPELIELDRKDFRHFYRLFNKLCIALYTLPLPVIASLTGHAVAGGCILALCCDYRFIAEGRKLMGLNEIKLGVSIPYPSYCILLDLAGTRYTREIVELGEFYEPEDSFKMGIIDKVLPHDELIQFSLQKAEQLASLPREAYAVIKKGRTEPIENHILERLKEKEERFIDLWFSAEARELLKQAMKKF